ncbi:MAG TPA: hypothetical protein VNC50_09005, partial [Planctomycetia bacterium]|nr:hypothetical protein [Planctomycetia bacterium]
MPTLSAEPDVSELGRLRDDLRPRQQTLRARFDALRGKVRSRLAAEGIAWALLYASAAFFITLLLDWQFRFGVGARRAFALAVVAGLVYLVYRGIVQPLRSRWTELDLARFLDRKRPGTSEQVAALLQLPDLLHARSGASAAMVQAAVEENAHRLESAVFADYLDRTRAKKNLALAATAVLAAVAFAAAQPFSAGLWWKRFALGASLNWPQRNFLEIQGLGPEGAFHAPRGEPLPLRVSAVEKLSSVSGGYQAPGRADVFAFPPGKDPAPQPPEQVRIQ